jgi:hypothetical protein
MAAHLISSYQIIIVFLFRNDLNYSASLHKLDNNPWSGINYAGKTCILYKKNGAELINIL